MRSACASDNRLIALPVTLLMPTADVIACVVHRWRNVQEAQPGPHGQETPQEEAAGRRCPVGEGELGAPCRHKLLLAVREHICGHSRHELLARLPTAALSARSMPLTSTGIRMQPSCIPVRHACKSTAIRTQVSRRQLVSSMKRSSSRRVGRDSYEIPARFSSAGRVLVGRRGCPHA